MKLLPVPTYNFYQTSFRTFRAVLYYLYTGFISFAPLTSSFRAPTKNGRSRSSITDLSNLAEYRHLARELVVKEYMRKYSNRPSPVSPKSVYALAKKYDLHALEVRSVYLSSWTFM